MVEKLVPGVCHKCGVPRVSNPHPDAGKPDRMLEVGCPIECLPCTVLSRHQWAQRAYAAEKRIRELKSRATEAEATGKQGVKFNEDAERQAFEDVIRGITDPKNHQDDLARGEFAHDDYACWPTQMAWEAWKARAAPSATVDVAASGAGDGTWHDQFEKRWDSEGRGRGDYDLKYQCRNFYLAAISDKDRIDSMTRATPNATVDVAANVSDFSKGYRKGYDDGAHDAALKQAPSAPSAEPVASVPKHVRSRLEFEAAGLKRSTNPLDRAAGVALAGLLVGATPTAPDDVARDAERYRWLRENWQISHQWGGDVWLQYDATIPGRLDNAIDAAIAATKEAT